jgi:hypothetical protein
LKKIIPIFLFIIICINHLNIIDAVIKVSARYNLENSKAGKDFSTDEESTEKESEGKEKIEEQDKYFTCANNNINKQYKLSAKDKYFYFNARLNAPPYLETDIQPPKAA